MWFIFPSFASCFSDQILLPKSSVRFPDGFNMMRNVNKGKMSRNIHLLNVHCNVSLTHARFLSNSWVSCLWYTVYVGQEAVAWNDNVKYLWLNFSSGPSSVLDHRRLMHKFYIYLLCYRTQSTHKKEKVHKKKRKKEKKQLTTNNMCTDHQLIH